MGRKRTEFINLSSMNVHADLVRHLPLHGQNNVGLAFPLQSQRECQIDLVQSGELTLRIGEENLNAYASDSCTYIR